MFQETALISSTGFGSLSKKIVGGENYSGIRSISWEIYIFPILVTVIVVENVIVYICRMNRRAR